MFPDLPRLVPLCPYSVVLIDPGVAGEWYPLCPEDSSRWYLEIAPVDGTIFISYTPNQAPLTGRQIDQNNPLKLEFLKQPGLTNGVIYGFDLARPSKISVTSIRITRQG